MARAAERDGARGRGVPGWESTPVTDLEPLKALTQLQTLFLQNTQVTDLEPLKGLTQLQYLYLNGTQVRGLEPLKGLTKLQRLDLSGTQVSLEEVRSLQKALPALKITGSSP